MVGMNLGDLYAGKGSMVPPLFMRGTKLKGIRPRVARNWFMPAGPGREGAAVHLRRIAVGSLVIVCLQDADKIRHARAVAAVAISTSGLVVVCPLAAPPDTLDEGRDLHHGLILQAN